MRQNKRGFCGAYLFNFTAVPRCSAERRQSSKRLMSHLQVIQAVRSVTTFYYLGMAFGEGTSVEANVLCKSKEDFRNKLLNYILFPPPSYASTPLKCSHCVDNE